MKLAYLNHNFTLQRFKHCKSEEGREELAVSYFMHDAEIVNEQMREALQKIEELEMKIKTLEGQNNE